MHFSSDLATEYTPAAYGWDYTNAIVPASMVPSYHGTSSYLLFCNTKLRRPRLAGVGGLWRRLNKIAILDPNATQVDPHPGANGLLEMREVMTVPVRPPIRITSNANNSAKRGS